MKRAIVTSCLDVVGAVSVTVGAFDLARPLGFIVAGAAAIGISWRLAPRGDA